MGRFGKSNKQTEHEYVEERLSPYLDGELLPKEQAVVKSHLASCQECQWNLETLRQTVQWTQELPTVPVPRMFTIPVPAEPVRAPRWQWSVPVFQVATALVAVLLFFAVTGDLMLTNLMPASESPSAVMLEREVVDVQMVETTVEAEAIPVGEHAPPADVEEPLQTDIEEPLAAEAVEEISAAPAAETALPASAPQKVLATEPARIAAEIVSTPTAESSTMGGPGLAPTAELEQEKESVAETDAAKPPPTTASADAAATETLAASDEVDPSPAPLPTIMPTATVVQPTIVAVAPEPLAGALGGDAVAEQETMGTWQQPFMSWLGVAEIALTVGLLLLLTTTIVLMLQRRRSS